MVSLSILELTSLTSNFFLMYVLVYEELTFLFCQCLFRGLRRSGSADEENEDKNKLGIRRKNINNDIFFSFRFDLVLNLAKQFLGRSHQPL